MKNPKLLRSGVIECIPQKGRCPNNCEDCFFQSGRAYLEPLEENLPHIPKYEETVGRIVRMNDGNDSNVQRDLVIATAKQYNDYFFNTAIPKDLDLFPGPVVLTANPGKHTDFDFFKIKKSNNIMFVRVRINGWNIESVVEPAVNYYSALEIPIILTYMRYYNREVPDEHKGLYEWKKKITNSYWFPTKKFINSISERFDNPWVYTCGHSCERCGHCIREYYVTKERCRSND